ncbi:putative Transmembrane protein [Mycena venus]|uniref:Putative Transmembrane protein n=1 Tax=Mycena venus TaxID=2733690 RepID=A0A8H7CEE0_9AGAR|nr:putative Transmembrane protein [Mycena venus]
MLDAGAPYVLETGPLLISGFLNWGLFGIIVVQMYTYMQWYYSTDGKLVRALAISLFVLELLQTIMTTHTCWVMLVLEWGNPLVFTRSPWSMVAIPIQYAIVASMVQIFFARRIWLLGKGLGKGPIIRYITVLIVTLSLVQWASELALTVEYCLHSNNDPAQLVKFKWLTLLWLITCFACDLSIAATQVYIFSNSKNNFWSETNTLLDRLIMRTIQSGVITATVAALHIVMFLKYPNTFLDLPPIYTLGKLYVNIVFANLNGRKRQIQALEIETSGISLEPHRRKNSAQSRTAAGYESTVGFHSANVHITTEIENSDDYIKKPTLRM